MAGKALAIGRMASVQEPFPHRILRPQSSKNYGKVSSIARTNELRNTRLAKEAMVSEPWKLLPEKSVLNSVAICAESFGTNGRTAIAVTPDRLHQWMTDSVMEIVRHIREAPFLYYIFERNVSSATPKRQRVNEAEESWPIHRDFLRNVSADGVILIKRLDEQCVQEYTCASESEEGKGKGMQDMTNSGCTNIWGLVIEGRGVNVSACYILKTTEIMSAHGCCTQFCVTKAKCFGASPSNQLTQSWLL